MFSKNEKFFYYIPLVIFLFLSAKVETNTDIKSTILDHLNSLKSFSASFIQSDSEGLSEGKVYIGDKRVRAEYLYPTKILIVLDEDKAMYYNHELEEDEFFNPKNTNAWFFYDIFRNPYFFKDSKVEVIENQIIIEKNGLDINDEIYLIKVFFENKPLTLRKVEFLINDDLLAISIFNHNYNEEFEENFFKLINPRLLN
tara:strand:- start:861 stop:1457 length:597 start_codon:yes stop_codon:yes gene_type:complete